MGIHQLAVLFGFVEHFINEQSLLELGGLVIYKDEKLQSDTVPVVFDFSSFGWMQTHGTQSAGRADVQRMWSALFYAVKQSFFPQTHPTSFQHKLLHAHLKHIRNPEILQGEQWCVEQEHQRESCCTLCSEWDDDVSALLHTRSGENQNPNISEGERSSVDMLMDVRISMCIGKKNSYICNCCCKTVLSLGSSHILKPFSSYLSNLAFQ